MGDHSVLGDKRCRYPLRVLVEQAVVSNAQPHYYVQVYLRLVEQLRLHNGVAHYLSGNAGVFLIYPYVGLIHRADLAAYPVHLKAVQLQYPREYAAFLNKPYAGRNAYLFCAYLAGKFDYLLHPRVLAVESALYLGGSNRYLVVRAVFYVEVRDLVYLLLRLCSTSCLTGKSDRCQSQFNISLCSSAG